MTDNVERNEFPVIFSDIEMKMRELPKHNTRILDVKPSEGKTHNVLTNDVDPTELNYEVTIFDQEMEWNVFDKVHLSRRGTACVLKEFGRFLWTDVSRMMEILDVMEPHILDHEGTIDDDPYTIHIVKKDSNTLTPEEVAGAETRLGQTF